MDSRTCAQCGLVWAKSGVYAKDWSKRSESVRKNGRPGEFGRITWLKWACSCGYKDHADRNAAVVVAQRTLAAYREQEEEKAAK
jgi:transposase